MAVNRFKVEPEHITLLHNAYVRWEDCETGAPAIDPKRPYGNSNVVMDIAELLGVTLAEDWANGYPEVETLSNLHRQTDTVLQIALDTLSFAPGEYVKVGYGKWELAQ